MRQSYPRSTVWLLGLLVATLFSVLTPVLSRSAQAAATDTPLPVAAGNVEEWAAGAGLLYWANNCYADEFNPFAELKRKPAGGGTERTLAAIEDYARCITFRNLRSADDGLYYFDYSQQSIERMPLSEPYTPIVVKALSINQFPAGNAFVEAGGYLYWVSAANKIYRVAKDGSGDVQTVAETAASPADVMVVGTTVYWTDSTGVWTTNVACASLPCAGNQQFAAFGANTGGYGLLYQPIGGILGNYRIYWVQRVVNGGNADYQIRYRSCNQFQVCVIAPPPPAPLPAASTFYGATINWRIGSLLLANNSLYWSESDQTTVINNNGDLKRRAYNAAAPGADTIATGQAKIDDQLFVANDTLFFARQNTGIYGLSLNAAAIVRDFAMDGMEVTQAIQNLANEVPLVAEKTTYVRAYGKQLSGPSAPNVEAWLVGTQNGNALPGSPLHPVNGVRALASAGGYDRARLSDGWYFLLPANWIKAGPIVLKAVIDPRQIHSDPSRVNNELSRTFVFQTQPPVCVWTVPVRTHTPVPSTQNPNFWNMVDHFKRRWPVPDVWIFRDTEPVEELQVCTWGPFPYPCYGPYELEDGWGLTNGMPDRDKVITSLWGRALLSFNPDSCDNRNAPVHFMGLVHPQANNGGASGYASTVSNQSWVQLPGHTPNPTPPGWDKLRAGSVMAQELAHNYGRRHVDCGNPEDTDGNYPYPPCQIANTGAASYYGFDVTTQQPIRPDQTADFMSYANRTWVSDYTWRALLGSFLSTHVAAAAAPDASDAGNSVFVTGLVDTANNRGKIAQVLQLPTVSVPPATRQTSSGQAAQLRHEGAPHAAYTLRLLDPSGAVLLARTLTLTELDDHSTESNSALFSDLFAPPVGQVATIQLLADSIVIDTLTPGINAPTIAIQQPAGNVLVTDNLTIQWTASDPDVTDRLRFTVQYSYNSGASWHTLALDIPNMPDSNNVLSLSDLGSLHGSGIGTAVIRILATDGYNTAVALSPAFSLSNRPPAPIISAPGAGQAFAAGQAVLLHGSATDAEDGGLGASALAWQIDGIGSGPGPDIFADGLAPGTHTAELAATDSTNQTTKTSVGFLVAPLAIPGALAPVLDGRCDDGGYAAGSSLPLKAYSDGAQANVRLLRSDDSLWVCFSGLKLGAPSPGSYAGIRIDSDHSRDTLAQPADAGFFAGEDGSVFTLAGASAGAASVSEQGGFVAPGPGGLQAQVNAGENGWSAELRIDKATVGGWDHLIGISLGHHTVAAAGDDYPWPTHAAWNSPATWATTALGSQPLVTALDPLSATMQGPSFTLTVEGSGFVSGTEVMWNGDVLPTMLIDSEHLSAQVTTAQLASAAVVSVKTRSPAPAHFESNALPFVVEAEAPVITGLSPGSVFAGVPGLVLTIDGRNFAADAQVLWNGALLPTQFVSPTQLKAQVGAALLLGGQTAGIVVRNLLPDERFSPVTHFEVQLSSRPFEVMPFSQALYMPVVVR